MIKTIGQDESEVRVALALFGVGVVPGQSDRLGAFIVSDLAALPDVVTLVKQV